MQPSGSSWVHSAKHPKFVLGYQKNCQDQLDQRFWRHLWIRIFIWGGRIIEGECFDTLYMIYAYCIIDDIYIYISLCIITYLSVWLWRAIFCIVWSVFHDRTRAPHHSLARIRCMALQVKEDVDLGPFRQSHRKGLIDDWGLKMLHVDSVDTSDKCKKKTRWQKRSCTLSASCWRSLCHWTLILGTDMFIGIHPQLYARYLGDWRRRLHDESVRRSAWRVLPWGWRKTLAYDGIQDSGRI